ncbi:sigma 54-interacting transcriptional regulator [Haliangium sp.]|uniref:sigma 54-interacting transcriptional regulator n=1 Tax=Haliangium sp. TaxID=2663208 RepID=UPI003D0B2F16
MSHDPITSADATLAADPQDWVRRDRAVLVVYDGYRDGRTRLVPVPEGAEVSFGRSRACTVHIDSERVSRTHARLYRSGTELTIEDLGSRNGTRVNGDRIDAPTRLRSGDEITLGPLTAVVSVTTGVERRRDIGEAAELDARLAAEADRGLRFQRRFGLIMMHLGGPDHVIDGALDRLVARLRPMDTVAEYSPEEYAVLVPEADLPAAQAAARALHDELRAQPAGEPAIKAWVGLAVFPDHGSQAGEILGRAQAALRRARAERAVDVVCAERSEPAPGEGEIVIADAQMERVYALVRKVADTTMTVLVIGETGAGKEVIAEAVHRASPRSEAPFIRLNCASIPENLLESELFGHERGAFTGADRQRAGYFEAADGGTLFLDEIGELSPGLQAKLLRVLEQRRITRVGGVRPIDVDTRVVCATNRDLEAEVAQGRFRQDLYFRISAFTIMVPPLRDRRAEIPLLAGHFARRAAREQGGPVPRISPAAAELLAGYDWPGNVRELRNAIERACVLEETGVIEPEHLPERVRDARARVRLPGLDLGPGPGADTRDVRAHIASIERDAIVAAMDACDGNQTHAARKLGMSRRSLIYKLEKYGLKDKPSSRR